jgi:hypothetical protein
MKKDEVFPLHLLQIRSFKSSKVFTPGSKVLSILKT